MIRAVLFDLFETLVSESGTVQTRASSLGEALGLDDSAFRSTWRQYRPRVVRGDLSFERALVDVGAQLNVGLEPFALQRACERRVREKAVVFQRIESELVAVIRGLHEQGIRLAVVSNCFEEDVRAWSGCALAPWFDGTVFSFAVGMAKPEPEIYLEATRRLAVPPENTLFIGDGADDELLGAGRAGLHAAQAGWFASRVLGSFNPGLPPWISSWSDVPQLVGAG